MERGQYGEGEGDTHVEGIYTERRNTEREHTPDRRLYEKEREDVERGHTRRENIDGEVTQTGRRLH